MPVIDSVTKERMLNQMARALGGLGDKAVCHRALVDGIEYLVLSEMQGQYKVVIRLKVERMKVA